uniref:Peptidase M14 domain-containing protein n=1 Tax=Timema genevievae TaxID=629358 RepID=A0A7R9PKT6_TIMGE|nr:unnamed protein product [Timema genevievae]
MYITSEGTAGLENRSLLPRSQLLETTHAPTSQASSILFYLGTLLSDLLPPSSSFRSLVTTSFNLVLVCPRGLVVSGMPSSTTLGLLSSLIMATPISFYSLASGCLIISCVSLIIDEPASFLESVSDRSIDGGSGINYCKENVNNKEDKIIFDHYPRWNEVNKYMDLLARSYPELVSIEEVGRTHENRTLRMLRISTARHGRRHRKAILIDGGIHAREWVAPAMVLYVVNQIVEHRSSNGEMLEGVDWFALPVVNPDGYEFTHSYVETRALSNFMLDNMPFIKMYLTFHSFGQT